MTDRVWSVFYSGQTQRPRKQWLICGKYLLCDSAWVRWKWCKETGTGAFPSGSLVCVLSDSQIRFQTTLHGAALPFVSVKQMRFRSLLYVETHSSTNSNHRFFNDFLLKKARSEIQPLLEDLILLHQRWEAAERFAWHPVVHWEIFLVRPVWISIQRSLCGALWFHLMLGLLLTANKGQIAGKLVVNVTRLWLADRRSHQRCRSEAAPFSYPQEKFYLLPQRCRHFCLCYFPLRDLISSYLSPDIRCDIQCLSGRVRSVVLWHNGESKLSSDMDTSDRSYVQLLLSHLTGVSRVFAHWLNGFKELLLFAVLTRPWGDAWMPGYWSDWSLSMWMIIIYRGWLMMMHTSRQNNDDICQLGFVCSENC